MGAEHARRGGAEGVAVAAGPWWGGGVRARRPRARSGRRGLRLAAVAALAVAAAAIAAAAPLDAHADVGTPKECGPLQRGTSGITSIDFRSPNGTYKLGDTIDIRVTVSGAYDAGSVGNPSSDHITRQTKIKLETGSGTERFADYLYHGLFINWAEWRYTVQAGDNSDDLDYDSRRALYWLVSHNGADHPVWNTEGYRIQCLLPTPGGPGSLANKSDIRVDGIVPGVANVTVDPDSLDGYGYGETVEFDINFNETVVYSGAAPVLRLNLGGGEFRNATYASGNNSNMLTFAYDVQRGDAASDLDYNGTMALATAGSLTDLAGNDADLTLPASGLISGPGPVAVDAVSPSVVSVSSPNANGTYAVDAYINVTVSFDEAVYVSGAPALELAAGAAGGRNATYASGNGSSVLAFNYTVAPGDGADDLDYTGTDSLSSGGEGIRDAAGNAANLTLPEPGARGSLGHSKDIGIDAAPPSVVSVSSPGGNGTYGTGRIVEIAVLFDKPVVLGGSGGNSAAGPRLLLDTDPPGHAEYAGGGSGTAEMLFLYTVRPGDKAARLDYAGRDALSLPGGSQVADATTGRLVAHALPLPEPGSPGSLGDLNRIGGAWRAAARAGGQRLGRTRDGKL